MSEVETFTLTKAEMHRKMAVDCFNLTWTYLVMQERTPEEDEAMLQATYASRFHWGVVGKPINYERGDWQISRVYAILGRGQEALHYAEQCLRICLEHEIGDFDLAYAYEALMRASLILGNTEQASEYEALARQAATHIAKERDHAWFMKEFEAAITAPRLCVPE